VRDAALQLARVPRNLDLCVWIRWQKLLADPKGTLRGDKVYFLSWKIFCYTRTEENIMTKCKNLSDGKLTICIMRLCFAKLDCAALLIFNIFSKILK
jgi:hypothetical protein